MFRFEDQYTMFDVTPVDNLFILEHMPGAQGDHVKVYLYGLMQCYHPQQETTIERMGQDLNLTEEEIMAAYRYWERRGLVHRVSDRPAAFRYVNAKKLMFMDAQTDPAYEAFAQAVHGLFDNKRKLYGKEVSRCYEWVEQIGLPQEVVLRLLERMIELRGPKFSFDSAEKKAMELHEAGAQSAEDVDVIIAREKSVLEGSRSVLRQFSLFREPTQPEMNLYRKWLLEWGFEPNAIMAACEDTTNGKSPSFKYLDALLKDRRDRLETKHITARQMEKIASEGETGLRALLKALNLPGVTVNDSTRAEYEKMQAIYPDDIILLAGRECAKRGCTFEDVLKTLRAWQRQGLRTLGDIEDYMEQVGQYNAFVDQLYSVWGKTSRSSAANRTLVKKWLEEWHFTREMIIYCAGYAKEAERPMPYLNGVLDQFRKQGVWTPGDAQAKGETKPARPAKTVREQQYAQRDYTDDQALPEWMLKQLEEMNGNA